MLSYYERGVVISYRRFETTYRSHPQGSRIQLDLFKRFIAQKVCTVYTRTSYKIVSLINLNKYIHYDSSKTEGNINVSVNNTSEKF